MLFFPPVGSLEFSWGLGRFPASMKDAPKSSSVTAVFLSICCASDLCHSSAGFYRPSAGSEVAVAMPISRSKKLRVGEAM